MTTFGAGGSGVRRATSGLGARLNAVLEAALERPRHVLLGALVVGLLVGRLDPRAGLAAAVLILLAGTAAGRPWLAVGAAAVAFGGAELGRMRLASLDRTALRPIVGHAIDVRATLLAPPRPQSFRRWTAPVRIVAGPGRGERVVLHGEAASRLTGAEVGDELEVRGLLTPLGRADAYERLRGAHAALLVQAARRTGRRRGGLLGVVDTLRRHAEAGVTTGLPPPQAALARGMVLGEDDALDRDTREDFQASGLAHVLAASGQNVMLLALFAIAALGLLGVGLHGRLVGALALVAVYVPLAGAGPSIERAGIMGAAGMVAGLAGRPGSRVYALLLAAAATLALNPRSSADVGWQLSFAAVVAIALLASRWREGLVRRRVPGPLADVVAVSAAATLGTAPLMALHFGQVSLVSLPANVLAAPAVAPIVWLGTGSALLGQAFGVHPAVVGEAAAAVASLVNAVAAFPLGFVGLVAHASASLPAATAAVAVGGPLALAGIYLALGAVVASRRMRVAALGSAAAVATLLLWGRLHPPVAPRDLTVSFLDIGQGDATLVQHDGHAVLVDTGPPDGPILERLRAAGVRRLDLLVITHAQADHEGAAAAILRTLAVGTVLDGGTGTPSPERSTIEQAERAAHVRTIAPDAGQVLRDGPIVLDVLWPRRASAGGLASGDPNDRAVVARLHDGAFDMLLAADAESPVTLPLDPAPVDVLKVAHHGSADEGLPRLLDRLHPALAAIEVGRGNSYGHPSASTLAALRVVPRVVRTDRDGTVRLTVVGDRMEVRTHA